MNNMYRAQSFTRNEKGDVRFIYKLSDIKAFLLWGFEHGNNGGILVGIEGKFYQYITFGTIENPVNNYYFLSVEHDNLFDGKQLTPEEVINPPKKELNVLSSYRLVFLNLTNNK